MSKAERPKDWFFRVKKTHKPPYRPKPKLKVVEKDK